MANAINIDTFAHSCFIFCTHPIVILHTLFYSLKFAHSKWENAHTLYFYI